MRKFDQEENFSWISVSDVMTGLMVIFLFIAVAYMIDVNKKQRFISGILDNYQNSRKNIAELLEANLGGDFDRWGAELDNMSLTIRFSGDNTQFEPSKDELSPGFEEVLDEFLPKYLAIISKPEVLDEILEVRIEGHAFESDEGFGKIFTGSQNRARNVLFFVRNHPSFKNLSSEIRKELEFRLTATGMGSGRMVDKEGRFVVHTNTPPCDYCSRRVEFTILIQSEKVIELIDENI